MLRPLINQLHQEISAQNCMDNVETIVRHHRIQASPGYRAAAHDCLRILRTSGLQATITTYPATGRRWEWAHLTPGEWACDDAELWLLDEHGRQSERLAWFQETNLSLIQRSCATPAEGVTAVLAAVDDAESAAAWEKADLRGKLVLVGNGDIHRIWTLARQAGAVGLITARMTPHPLVRPAGDLPDALQYTSFWWSEDEARGWGFVVSTSQGERLRQMLGRQPVRLHARVAARFYDGAIENVEALIPGRETGEILIISHLCHPKPSSNDNATGPATVMETARALQRLIDEGHLQRPRRSIRFLHPPEMTGTFAHLAARPPADRQSVAAGLNVDMVGQNQAVTGSVLLCEYPPLACPSFAGDLLALVLGEVVRETTAFSGIGTRYALFRHAVTAFSGGSDHYIAADPSVGIPCPMIIQWPDRFYHTSADTPDKVDPAMMRRVGVMTGAYAYFLANAGPAEVAWLAAEMTALFPAQLHEALRCAADPEAIGRFRAERKLADLGALRRLLSPDDDPSALDAVLTACTRQIHLTAELALQRVAMATPNLPASAPVPPDSADVAGWLSAADLSAVRPSRIQPGPIGLRNHLPRLSPSDRESWRAFAAAHPDGARLADYLCYWADGERTLADVCRLAELETGLSDPSFALGYFQLLGRLGLASEV